MGITDFKVIKTSEKDYNAYLHPSGNVIIMRGSTIHHREGVFSNDSSFPSEASGVDLSLWSYVEIKVKFGDTLTSSKRLVDLTCGIYDSTVGEYIPAAKRTAAEGERFFEFKVNGASDFYIKLDNLGEEEVTGENIGTGDGNKTSFSHTCSKHPVKPNSVTVHYTIGGNGYTATDDGDGNISGTNCSGTINYETGEVSLTFSSAPDNGTSITIDYTGISKVDVYLTPFNL